MNGSPNQDPLASPVLPTNYAQHACSFCKQRKRKCDKALPACGLCTKKCLECVYTKPTSPSSSSTLSNNPYDPAQFPQDNTVYPPSNFPAVFFLDASLFQLSNLEIPKPPLLIPSYVTSLLGDSSSVREVASHYFGTIHRYFSIVSRTRFYGNLLNPLAQPRADVSLLLLCMRLITLAPHQDVSMASVPEYIAAKRFHNSLEQAGVCSTQVLQSGALIALYEFGHSIYPAAHLSIGGLARYGISYGYDVTELREPPGLNWIEVEEKRRVWWAVLILDRCVNLGNPSRALATQEPHPSVSLPMDDAVFDKGGPQPLTGQGPWTVSSPTTLSMGRFARFAQATYLLGRVLKHVSDRTTDREFLEGEAIQLRRTLNALANLVRLESTSAEMEFCTQSSVCYAGMLLLQGSYGSLGSAPELTIEGQEQNLVEWIAKETEIISSKFLSMDSGLSDRISPFLLHLIYQSNIIYNDIYRATGTQASIDGLRILNEVMTVLAERWKAADAYQEILKAREMTLFY